MALVRFVLAALLGVMLRVVDAEGVIPAKLGLVCEAGSASCSSAEIGDTMLQRSSINGKMPLGDDLSEQTDGGNPQNIAEDEDDGDNSQKTGEESLVEEDLSEQTDSDSSQNIADESLDASAVRPPAPGCQSWCAKNMKPWSTKCGYAGACDGCDACGVTPMTDTPTKVPTHSPTVKTTPTTPQVTLENCQSWCANNMKPWSTKCGYTGACDGCDACGVTPMTDTPTKMPTPTMAPTTPEVTIVNCQSWCAKNMKPWSTKCGYAGACDGCHACGVTPVTDTPTKMPTHSPTVKTKPPTDTPTELPTPSPTVNVAIINCKTWCGGSPKPWSTKCTFGGSCDGCGDCDATAPATEEPTAAPDSCQSWCAKNMQPWTTKCGYSGACDGCPDCSTTHLPMASPTESPTTSSVASPTTARPTAAPKLFFGAVWKSPTCVDYSECDTGSRRNCNQDWAIRRCPFSCGSCTLCELEGEWSEWTKCSATCGTGGQSRTRGAGTCDEPSTESRQCNLNACAVDECTLATSSPIRVQGQHNKLIENIFISSTGSKPAIDIHDSINVTIRNVHIVHEGSRAACHGAVMGCSGPGIYFSKSPGITIENVKVELRRAPNKHAKGEGCTDHHCGPFPKNMAYAFNIQGYQSIHARLHNVHVSGGSSGFWCSGCEHGVVSHFKAENVHGPYPRGQCLQVTNSDRFTLEDFYCFNDKRSFTEDTISLWESSDSIVRRGVVDGGNGPNGVGIMLERSHDSVVEDVDVVNNRKGAFSGYGSSGVLFLRDRAKDNHGPNKQCREGVGECMDHEGTNHCCGGTHPDGNTQGTCISCTERLDCGGDVWYAGDYGGKISGGKYSGKASNIRIKQGVVHNLATGMAWGMQGKCTDVTPSSWEVAGAGRDEAYIERDFMDKDFVVRQAVDPVFCWDR